MFRINQKIILGLNFGVYKYQTIHEKNYSFMVSLFSFDDELSDTSLLSIDDE